MSVEIPRIPRPAATPLEESVATPLPPFGTLGTVIAEIRASGAPEPPWFTQLREELRAEIKAEVVKRVSLTDAGQDGLIAQLHTRLAVLEAQGAEAAGKREEIGAKVDKISKPLRWDSPQVTSVIMGVLTILAGALAAYAKSHGYGP